MTYVLRETIGNSYFCKEHNKIIEFENPQLAQNFLNGFGQYAMAQAMPIVMQDPGIIMNVQQVLQSTIIEEKPENCSCEFITYEQILRDKGI